MSVMGFPSYNFRAHIVVVVHKLSKNRGESISSIILYTFYFRFPMSSLLLIGSWVSRLANWNFRQLSYPLFGTSQHPNPLSSFVTDGCCNSDQGSIGNSLSVILSQGDRECHFAWGF